MIEIVSNINARIISDSMLDNTALYGIAEPIVIRHDNDSQDIVYPVIIDIDGECRDVLFDDAHDIVSYHRLNKKTYATKPVDGYGDYPQRSVVYDMSMIVCGKRKIINAHNMERVCVRSIESATNYAKRITAEVAESNFNSPQVFSSEYTGVQYPIQPDIFLFKINYKITRIQSPCKN